MFNPPSTIRVATAGDLGALELLSQRTRHRPWTAAGWVLIAERDAVPVAAIALTSGVTIADPLSAPRDAVAALRFARYRMMRQAGQIGAARSLLRRARAATLAPLAQH